MSARRRHVAAVRAKALNLHLVPQDHEVRGPRRLPFEALGDLDLQVVDPAAAEASDVVVPLHVPIEASRPGDAADFPDQPKGHESLEVAVYGAKADPGEPSAGLRVDPGSRRMLHRGPHDREDDGPLFRPLARHK